MCLNIPKIHNKTLVPGVCFSYIKQFKDILDGLGYQVTYWQRNDRKHDFSPVKLNFAAFWPIFRTLRCQTSYLLTSKSFKLLIYQTKLCCIHDLFNMGHHKFVIPEKISIFKNLTPFRPNLGPNLANFMQKYPQNTLKHI